MSIIVKSLTIIKKVNMVNSSPDSMPLSAVVPTLLDRTLVHRRYLPNNVGSHLQLSVLGQIGVNEIA